MLTAGIYPAAITPFDSNGKIDYPSVARLLAWFEAGGCKGAVLAGTNGEGPSLSAVEKRDLLRAAMPLRGSLELILGIATCSSEEAIWLCKQAFDSGAGGVLLMPPFYFREAGEKEIGDWFELVMSRSPIAVIVYNFPKRAGVTLSPDLIARLSRHEKFAGAKDSSGDASNLSTYKAAAPDKVLFVGDETLLMRALNDGWTGSISGAANTLPQWLSQIASEWVDNNIESAETKFELILPLLGMLRSAKQPAMNKALLHKHGVISLPDPRLPLLKADDGGCLKVAEAIKKVTGFAF